MKTVAIVQARMGSSRLPGKVMTPIAGMPMVAHQLKRLATAKSVDSVVVATTWNPIDDPIEALCKQLGFGCFRGSETDVLARYHYCAREFGADVIVRLTADCPLLDPAIVDKVVLGLLASPEQFDYASNTIQRTYPRGLDVEAFFVDTLNRVHRMARSESAREHVTWHINQYPSMYSRLSLVDGDQNDTHRWTIDTPSDMQFLMALENELKVCREYPGYREILNFLATRPDISRINAHVEQKQ